MSAHPIATKICQMGGGDKSAQMGALLDPENRRLSEAIAEARHLTTRLADLKREIALERQHALLLRERLHLTCVCGKGGSFHWHRPSGAFECDDELARLYGRTHADEMSHEQLFAGLDVEDARALRLHWDRCANRDVPFELEVRVPEHGAGARWIGVAAKSFPCEESGPRCIIGACTETTARHQAHAAAELHELADRIPQLVWIAGSDGKLEYTNDRWVEHTGRRDGDEQGLFGAVAEHDRPRVRQRWLAAVRAGHDVELEARLVSRSGQLRWFLVRAVPMLGSNGTIVRWAGTCTDIDQQKRSELALGAARDVRDRAMATLGHELRTPLSTMTVTLDLVRNRAPTLGRECSSIARQVGRMVQMVDDMLDVTRAAQDRVAIRKRPTDIALVLSDAIDTCAKPLKERAHKVTTQIARSLIVEGDADRLLQVFVNLIANAAKYTPRRGHISIRAARWDNDIVVEVQDDGIGIVPELRDRLFEPFVQGEVSSTRAGGLGLGLSIAKTLVELHGGTIAVASEGPRRGSTFTVRLPAKRP